MWLVLVLLALIGVSAVNRTLRPVGAGVGGTGVGTGAEAWGAAGMTLGTGMGGGSGCCWGFRRICCSVRRVATLLSASGDRGESVPGLLSAVMRSLATAITRSVLEATGIATWWGNHVTVSVIRVPLVLVIQTL